MPKFIMMVGPAASGKSSMVQKVVRELSPYYLYTKTIVLSSDALRQELLGDVNDQSKNSYIFETMNRRLHDFLSLGYDIIYDATNLSMKRRKALLDSFSNEINEKYEKICYVMVARPETLYKLDELRDRTVGREVIKKQIKQFQCPQYFEGWDHIVFKTIDQLPMSDMDYLANLYNACKIPHDNAHHKLDIYDHMLETASLVSYYYDESILFTAAMMHDIGKPFCKDFINCHGQRDDEAHYYGHQNAGAYLALMAWSSSFDKMKEDESMLRIIGLINYHMEPYIRKNAYWKFEEKINKDQWLVENLKKLHRCDKEAH